MNGAHGEYQAPPKTNGTTGKPGNPGKNSGSFFGLAYHVINGHLLTVEIIGGNGGKGQDGTGNVDVRVELNKTQESISYKEVSFIDNAYERTKELLKSETGVDKIELVGETPDFKFTALVWTKIILNNKFRLYANQCCGSAGLGGSGGINGISGHYDFTQIGPNADILPLKKQKNGKWGENGTDAVVCKTEGLYVETDIDTDIIVPVFPLPVLDVKINLHAVPVKEEDCLDDKNVRTTEIFSKPNPPKRMDNAVTISQYKNYLVGISKSFNIYEFEMFTDKMF